MEVIGNGDSSFHQPEAVADWWPTQRVPQNIKTEVAARIQKELDAGVTRRSMDELDYTTFGALSGTPRHRRLLAHVTAKCGNCRV
jgi:hypothetical protein